MNGREAWEFIRKKVEHLRKPENEKIKLYKHRQRGEIHYLKLSASGLIEFSQPVHKNH